MDDCDEMLTHGLTDLPYMSVFNDFEETVTYGKDMFHGRIIEGFSIMTIESTTADNHEITLGTGTNDLENVTGLTQTFTLAKWRELLECLAIPLILVTLLPTLVVLIVTMNPVVRMNYFLIVIISPVLRMNYFLIVTLNRCWWNEL